MKPSSFPIVRASALLLLVVALWPEVRRYQGERRLYVVVGVLQQLAADPGAVTSQGAAALAWATEAAEQASPELPGDPRPLLLAGSAHLMARHADPALHFYRQALLTGERLDLDVNLGRAYLLKGDAVRAEQAFLRAAWIEPGTLSSLPEDWRSRLTARVSQLYAATLSGALTSPPPLPTFDPP